MSRPHTPWWACCLIDLVLEFHDHILIVLSSLVCYITCVHCATSLRVHVPGNVAFGKKASQVGAYGGQVASRAVDGVTTPDGNKYCAHPDTTGTGESIAWWEVDLGHVYVIDSITIFNGPESKRK